jgi:4-amino-4-deoxy-L-arabinose transferase-like glycosyltransferase
MSDTLLPVPPPAPGGEPAPGVAEVRDRAPAGARPTGAAVWSPGVVRNVFLVGLALRVGYLTLARTYLMPPGNFGFGWEMGRIASALASGRGFADPFQGHTGPTAWVAPVFPLIIAGVFKVLGIYTTLSGWVVLLFNSVCSCLTAVVLYFVGTEIFGEKIGRRTAWVWAVFPYTVYWPTRVIWDTNLTACLLTVALWLTVRLGRDVTGRRLVAFGLLWGLAALTNPATLTFFVPSWGWVIRGEQKRGSLRPGRILGALFLALLPIGLWMLRNERVLGAPVFIRDNFGEELRLGNGPGGHGEWMVWLHPTHSVDEFRRYEAMGELRYVASRGSEAVASIRENVPLFLANCVRRANWFWFGTTRGEAWDPIDLLRSFTFAIATLLCWSGLALMRREGKKEWVLFFWLFALFPLVYYVTFVVTRYRHPIEPEMILLIVYALSAPRGRPRGRLDASYDLPITPALGPLPPGVMRSGHEG